MSVSIGLELLSQAAGGETLEQLQRGLRNGNDKTAAANKFFEHRKILEKNAGQANFSIANAIYVRENLKLRKSFEEVAISKFKSEIKSLNFADTENSIKTINHFVRVQTNGKIKELFKPDQLKLDTVSVLVNAIYFKGDWEIPFYSRETKKQDFYNHGKETVQVDFMNKDSYFNVAEIDELDATAVELKYANSSISFVIVLPDSYTGLNALEEELNYFNLTNISEKFKSQKYEISVPKFKIESEIDLKNVLQNVSFTVDCSLSILKS